MQMFTFKEWNWMKWAHEPSAHISTSRCVKCYQFYYVIANLLFYPFSRHLTQFHGVNTESKNSIAEHVRWDYNLSLCGGCRSTKRLYFLIYCNPHLFCFFKRNTALRSLSDNTTLDRTVAKCSCPASKCFLYLFAFCRFLIAVTLPDLPLTKCWKTQPHLILSFLDFLFELLILAAFCSAAAQDSKQVTFVVELGNRVSRIYPFNLSGDLHGTEKESHSFGFQW